MAFSAIDDCSRYIFSKCYPRETADNGIRFVNELIRHVPYIIKRIRVDNRYGKKFKDYCEKVLGIEVIANDPYRPNQNGKIERFNKTLKYDFFWTYCKYFESMELINYKLHQWQGYYNYERKHTGLDMHKRTPAQKIASTLHFSTIQTYINTPHYVLQQYTI